MDQDDDIIDVKESEIEVIDNRNNYCWCCGYPSDDLYDMVLEDARRLKCNCTICSVCLDAPWVLDAWLNPWLYNPDTSRIFETIAFNCNRVLDEIRQRRPNEHPKS